jgi:hydroxymethylglutaryl-CoA lyase
MASEIILHEVGMRDGLQVEEKIVPTEKKLEWIKGLLTSGIDIIQLGSFVNPQKVPQMGDTGELFRSITAREATLSCLVLNEKGLERALASGAEQICMGVSASETHSMKNTGMTTDEALKRIIAMAKQAAAEGRTVQLSVQSAFGCGYEGRIPNDRVLYIIRKYLEAGFKFFSLADTAGHANPDSVKELFGLVFNEAPEIECACHFHDTYGIAMANCYSALEAGVKYFESSFAGLGGCPFTALASGNVCTEDFVHMLQRMGLRKDVNINAIVQVSNSAEKFFGRQLPGVIHRTGTIPVAAGL